MTGYFIVLNNFRGSDKSDQLYEATLNLYGKVDESNLHKVDTCRQLELNIAKAEPEWWPRLLKESQKVSFVCYINYKFTSTSLGAMD